jgi:hypothetical protein
MSSSSATSTTTTTKNEELTSQLITWEQSIEPLNKCLSEFISVKPLCTLVSEYAIVLPSNKEKSYYDMRKYRQNSNKMKIRFDYAVRDDDIIPLLNDDNIQEIEITQDANMGGAYYRAYIRIRRSDKTTCHSLGKAVEIFPSRCYEVVPLGGPSDDWPLPFPPDKKLQLVKLPKKAVYQLSNGIIFDLFYERYQCKFVRRFYTMSKQGTTNESKSKK